MEDYKDNTELDLDIDESIYNMEDDEFEKLANERDISDALKEYLRSIGGFKKYTLEEELELGKRISEGDQEAKKALKGEA